MSEIEKVIAKIAEKSAITIEGTYFDDGDGLLHCSKCRKPRQSNNPYYGKVFIRCACDDLADAEAKRRSEITNAESTARTSPLFDPNYCRFTFDVDDAPDCEASSISRSFVKHFCEIEKDAAGGLIFSGTVGTGKSFYASCIVNALRSQGIPALIVSTSRLLNTIRSSKDGAQMVIDDLNRFRLIAIDDLGAERNTDYALEQLENVVDARALSNRPMIVTTNLTGKQLSAPEDIRFARLFDRVRLLCPRPIILTGKSRRDAERLERVERIERLLSEE